MSKVNFFLDKMYKIIGQFDDFGCFSNDFYNFGVFWPNMKKYCFEKGKITRKNTTFFII